ASASNARGSVGAFSSSTGAEGAGVHTARGNNAAVARGANGNVYAGADGNVYRHTDNGWSKWNDGGWQPVQRPNQQRSGPAGDSLHSGNVNQLDQDRCARNQGGWEGRQGGGGGRSFGGGGFRG